MSRLVYYEILKLVRRKSFWVLLISAICVNVLLVNVSKTANDENGYKQYYYEQIYDELKDMSTKDAIAWLTQEEKFYSVSQEYKLYLDFPDFFDKPDIETVDIKRYEKYEDASYYWDERASVITELTTYYESIDSYSEYLNGINGNLEKIMDGPLWATLNEKEREDIIVQVDTYGELADIHLNTISYRSIEQYAKSMISKLLALIFVCATVVLIVKDDEENMYELIRATSNGNEPLGIAKVITFAIVAGIGVVVISVSDVLCHMIIYGNCNLHSYIQSLPSFYTSSSLLTIGQWLGITILYFGFGVCVLGLIFMFFYHLFENKVFSFLSFFLLFFIEAILYVVIPAESILAGFTHMNVLQLFSNLFIGTFISYYHVFFVRLSTQVLLMVILLLIGVVAIVLFVGLYDKKIHGKKLEIPHLLIRSTNMFTQEGNRILQNNKGVFILLLTLLISVSIFVVRYNNYETLRTDQKEVYEIYEEYEGVITEDKENDILSQINSYTESKIEYEEAKQLYIEEKLSYEELLKAESKYNEETKGIAVYNELTEMLQNEDHYIVYNKGFSAIFALKQIDRDAIRSILLILLLILFVSCISYKEEEEMIYKTTYNGMAKRRNVVLVHMIFGVLFLSFIVELFSFLHFKTLYPMNDYNVSMNYLFLLDGQLPIKHLSELNAGSYMLLLYIIRLFGVLSVGIISTCLFRISKNRIIGLLLCFALIFIPMFLYYNGFTFMSYVSLFDLVMGNLFLQKTFSFIKLLMIFTFDVICIKLTFKSFKI